MTATHSTIHEVTDLLSRLISLESHENVPGQEKQLAVFMQRYLKEHGVTASLQPLPGGRCNLIARIGVPGSHPSLMFNGHLDTVPPGLMKKPFTATLRKGRIYGRGSVDMKGALAVMMRVLCDLKKSNARLSGQIVLAATAGEEKDSIGTERLIASGMRADYIIVGEPTELQVGTAHKGVVRAGISFAGRAAHASVPEKGINAIHRAADFINLFKDKYLPSLAGISHPLLGSPTANVGRIAGGERPAIVPAKCIIELEKRTLPGETEASVLREFRQLAREATARAGKSAATVALLPVFNGIPHGPFEASADGRLPKVLLEAFRLADGRRRKPVGLQYWTDAHLFSAIPDSEVVVCGPGSIAQAHTEDEYVCVSQLGAAYNAYHSAAVGLCGITADTRGVR